MLNTHWHPDHTGGNQAIHEATGAPVSGPDEVRRVYQVDRVLAEGDRIAVGAFEAEVWEIPAHTAGHIALYFQGAKAVFVGDTLFAMGCGRLFEGTAEQMHANLQRLAAPSRRDASLLRPRIYAGQRPLRGDGRTGQLRRWPNGWGESKRRGNAAK